MSPEPQAPEPFRCPECGMSLPIIVRQSPDAVPVVCAYCGSRYLGDVWPAIPDKLRGNIRVVKD